MMIAEQAPHRPLRSGFFDAIDHPPTYAELSNCCDDKDREDNDSDVTNFARLYLASRVGSGYFRVR